MCSVRTNQLEILKFLGKPCSRTFCRPKIICSCDEIQEKKDNLHIDHFLNRKNDEVFQTIIRSELLSSVD